MKKYLRQYVQLLALGLGITSLTAQDEAANLREQDLKTIRATPGVEFRGGVGKPVANVELPEHVLAEKNAVTFFADFEHTDEKGVPLYLVNRTDRELRLATQDHNPYVKLEFRNEKGQWIRAQAHLSSSCGNSYYPVKLEPGQHFSFHGYQSKDGVTAQVRFRSLANPELVSNVGVGRINASDVAAVEMDDLTASSVPDTLRSELDLNRFIHAEGKSEPAKYLAALNLLSLYHDNPYYRLQAQRYLAKLDRKTPEYPMIQSILGKPWPIEPDHMALFKHIEAVISGKQPPSPMNDKEMALRVLTDLISNHRWSITLSSPTEESNETVGRIYGQIGELLTHGKSGEADAVAALLAVTKVTDEFVKTEKLRAWLEHENAKVVEVSAQALSRRGDLRFLVEKGFQLNPNSQISVLKALATGGGETQRVSRNPDDSKEVEFWKHCATTQPTQTVNALQYIGNGGLGRHSFNMVLHDPLLAFLEKEADLAEKDPQAASNTKDAYPVAQVLQFVGAWQREEDIPLFRRLLKHPGYQTGISYESKGGKSEIRRYRVREDAKDILIRMGVSIPEDLVLEEKIPLPDEPKNK